MQKFKALFIRSMSEEDEENRISAPQKTNKISIQPSTGKPRPDQLQAASLFIHYTFSETERCLYNLLNHAAENVTV